MITVEVNDQTALAVIESERLRDVAVAVLQGEGISAGHLSVAIVDDATSQELNRRYLQHDYPTDVLSFNLQAEDSHDGPEVEGEVIVSADTALRASREYGWSTADELLLYVVHGVLHLVGYDDKDDAARHGMRQRERHYLSRFGLTPRYDD